VALKKSDRRGGERRRSGQPTADEQRQSERRRRTRREKPRVEIEIWVEEIVGQDRYLRRTRDLSEQGVAFDVALPSAVGQPVSLRFKLPGRLGEIAAEGEVVSVGTGDAGLGMGIRFTRIEGDGARRIRELVRAVLEE